MMKLTAAAAALGLMISLGGCATGERETEAVGEGTIGGAAGEAPAGGVRTTDEAFETRTETDVETRRGTDLDSPRVNTSPDLGTPGQMGSDVRSDTGMVPGTATEPGRQTNPETGLIPENDTSR